MHPAPRCPSQVPFCGTLGSNVFWFCLAFLSLTLFYYFKKILCIQENKINGIFLNTLAPKLKIKIRMAQSLFSKKRVLGNYRQRLEREGDSGEREKGEGEGGKKDR